MTDLGWILSEPIEVELLAADTASTHVRVTRERDGEEVIIALVDSELLIAGSWVDVGDDFPCFLGLIDEAALKGWVVLGAC